MSTHKSYTPPVPIEFYSVGDIYITTKSGNPYTWLQYGEWTQIQDCFLLAAGSTYSAGATGGEATHTLTVSEMPAHTHGAGDPDGTRGFWRGGATARSSVQSGSNVTSVVRSPDTSVQYFWNTAATGDGVAHNNMPPYLVVYVWKRVA